MKLMLSESIFHALTSQNHSKTATSKKNQQVLKFFTKEFWREMSFNHVVQMSPDYKSTNKTNKETNATIHKRTTTHTNKLPKQPHSRTNPSPQAVP